MERLYEKIKEIEEDRDLQVTKNLQKNSELERESQEKGV